MRVAVVTGPAPGHAFPAAALALAMRAAGHEVAVLTGADWLRPLARAGLVAEELPLLAPTVRDADFGYLLWGRSVEMAPATAAVLRRLGVEGVVTDTLTVAGRFAAELAGVPCVELVPHPLADPSRALPPPGSGLAAGRGPLGRGRDGLLRRLAARSRAAAAAQQARARAELGLAGPTGPLAGRLVATLPGLEPERPDWPADTYVVGPLEWDPVGADLAAPPGDGPLLVLAASTAAPPGSRAAGLVEVALAALAGDPPAERVRLAVTRLEPYADPLPPWAAVGRGRQAPLLAEARRTRGAVVCGGGHGMVAKALVRGLPLVCVPSVGDQWDNARRVARAGAGVLVPPARLRPAALAAAVRAVLADPGHAAAARRIGATGRGLGPAYAARVAADLLAGVAPVVPPVPGAGRTGT